MIEFQEICFPNRPHSLFKSFEAQKARPKTPAATPDENSEAEDNSQFRVTTTIETRILKKMKRKPRIWNKWQKRKRTSLQKTHARRWDDFEDEEREKPEQDGSIDEEGVEIKKRPIENIESEPPKNGGGIYSVKPEGNHSTNIRVQRSRLLPSLQYFLSFYLPPLTYLSQGQLLKFS